jgi:hypothetical protein
VAISDRRAACAPQVVDRSLGDVPPAVEPAGGSLRTPARTQQHERRAGAGADDQRGGRARPVARVAHRGELPRLELVGGHLGDARERALQALDEIRGRLDGRERFAQQALEVVRGLSHGRSPRAA